MVGATSSKGILVAHSSGDVTESTTTIATVSALLYLIRLSLAQCSSKR